MFRTNRSKKRYFNFNNCYDFNIQSSKNSTTVKPEHTVLTNMYQKLIYLCITQLSSCIDGFKWIAMLSVLTLMSILYDWCCKHVLVNYVCSIKNYTPFRLLMQKKSSSYIDVNERSVHTSMRAHTCTYTYPQKVTYNDEVELA